jgi:hypothetical protein|tara:strand:- start:1516 stop:1758 length:243 start_codon:yes stop_codon:yes gene_type:complete
MFLDGHFESFVVFIIIVIIYRHHHVAKTILFNFVLLYKTENNKQRKKERKKERKTKNEVCWGGCFGARDDERVGVVVETS